MYVHRQLGKNDHGIESVRRIAVMLPTVSDEQVALITDEWKMLQSGDEVVDTSQRVDHYWASVFQEKTSQDQFRYSILAKLVKSFFPSPMAMLMLNLVFPANKRTVTADRASLSDVTINGLRTVKDQVKFHGRPDEVPITSGLLLASREAHQAYVKQVSGEEEAERVHKLKANQEVERRKEEEIVKQKEAEKMEKSRKKLAEKEEQLRNQKIRRKVSFKLQKALYEEGSERLSETLRNRNFSDAAVASGLLGVAKKRMDSAMEQANSCFSKQKLLESTRKRILDGYSKQIASKKS